MQGKIIQAIATKNMSGVITIGDIIEVECVLYNEDTIIVNEMWRYHEQQLVKCGDAVFAKKDHTDIVLSTTEPQDTHTETVCLDMHTYLHGYKKLILFFTHIGFMVIYTYVTNKEFIMELVYITRSTITGKVRQNKFRAWKEWGDCKKEGNEALHRKASVLLNAVIKYRANPKRNENAIRIAMTRFIRGWVRLNITSTDSGIKTRESVNAYVNMLGAICGKSQSFIDTCINDGMKG